MSAESPPQPPGRLVTRASLAPSEHRSVIYIESTDDDQSVIHIESDDDQSVIHIESDDDQSIMFDFEPDGNQADYSSSAASNGQTDDETAGQHHGNRRVFEAIRRPQLQSGRRPTNIARAIIGRMAVLAPPATTYLHAYYGPPSSIVDAVPSPPPTAPLPIPPPRSTITRGGSPGPLRYPWQTRRHRVYPTGDDENDADQSDFDSTEAVINSPISPEFRLEKFYGLRYGNYTGPLEPLKPKPRPATFYHSSDTQFDDSYDSSSINSSVPACKVIPKRSHRPVRRRRTAGRYNNHPAAALPRSRRCSRCRRPRRTAYNRGSTRSHRSMGIRLSVNRTDVLSFAAAATANGNDAQTSPEQAVSGTPSRPRRSGVTRAPAHRPFALFDHEAGMFLGNTTDAESTRRARANQEEGPTVRRQSAMSVTPAAYNSQPPAPTLAPAPVLVPASDAADSVDGFSLSSYQYPSAILDSARISTLRRVDETTPNENYQANILGLIEWIEALRRGTTSANQEEQSQEPSLESQVRQRLLNNPHEIQMWRAILKEVSCGTHLSETLFVNFGPVAQSQVPDGEEPADKGKGKQVAREDDLTSNGGSSRSNRHGESSQSDCREIERRGVASEGIDNSGSSGSGSEERGENEEDEEDGGAGLREIGAHSIGGSFDENNQQDNEPEPQPSQSLPSQQSPPSTQRRSHFKRLPRRAHRYEPYYFGELDPVPQASLATSVAGDFDTAASTRTHLQVQTPSTAIAGPSRTEAPTETVPQPSVADRSPFEGLSGNQGEKSPAYNSPLVVNGSSSATFLNGGSSSSAYVLGVSGSPASPLNASGNSASSLDASDSSASPFDFNSSEGDSTPRLYQNETSSSEQPYFSDDYDTNWQPSPVRQQALPVPQQNWPSPQQDWPSPPGAPPRMTLPPPSLPPLMRMSTSNGIGELQNFDSYHNTQHLPTSFPQQLPQHSRQAYSPPMGPLPPLPTSATPFSNSIRNGRLNPQPSDYIRHGQPSSSWQQAPSPPPRQNLMPALSSPISLPTTNHYYGEQQYRDNHHDPFGRSYMSQQQAPPLTTPQLPPTLPSPSEISPLSIGQHYGEQRHHEYGHRPYEQPSISQYQTPSRPARPALTPPPYTSWLPSSSSNISNTTTDVPDERQYHEESQYTRRRPSSYWQQTPPQQWLPPVPTPPQLSALPMPPQPQLPPLSSLLSTTQPEELGPLDYYEPELQTYFRNGSSRHRIRFVHRQARDEAVAPPPGRHTSSRTESFFSGGQTLTNSYSRERSLMPPPPRPLPLVYTQQRSHEPRIVKSHYPARR